jgi:hypothetical protein
MKTLDVVKIVSGYRGKSAWQHPAYERDDLGLGEAEVAGVRVR